ncbi:hypothetical protein BSL78_05196 [Apostichopus japonicus]|uniref:Uncharacterized protein n=1 Tax=Stichopus japonicus TaxID=307972 RepID=A0A2G8LCH7_STIJA|nr:hypothetical protein BSL78_05196 [Apostichopus japonicus]
MRVSLSSSLLVPADTATQSTVTSGSEPPLNFGEREVEIEIETEGKNKQKEKDSEMELEIESESDYEMDLECLGKACQKDGKSESDQTDRGSPSSRLHLELLRTIAVLCMTAVAVLTIIVLATAIFCVLKRRENRRNNQEERKDLGRRHMGGHRGYHGENKGSPSIGNIPINQSQNNEPEPGGLQQRQLAEYHEATPVSSRRHSPAVMATPPRGEPEYSLVVETQYASIDDDVIASGTAKGHYYFKLDSEASKFHNKVIALHPTASLRIHQHGHCFLPAHPPVSHL